MKFEQMIKLNAQYNHYNGKYSKASLKRKKVRNLNHQGKDEAVKLDMKRKQMGKKTHFILHRHYYQRFWGLHKEMCKINYNNLTYKESGKSKRLSRKWERKQFHGSLKIQIKENCIKKRNPQ